MAWAEQYPEERLVDYVRQWPAMYDVFVRGLRETLGPGWRFEHVGSTSVPGLLAKPVIDLALRRPEGGDVHELAGEFGAAGWSAPRVVGDHWATFYPSTGRRAAIAHIFTAAQWPVAHVRLFARWLRSHPSDRQRYEDLKRGLVADGVWGADYTRSKAEFVLDIVNRARQTEGLAPIVGQL